MNKSINRFFLKLHCYIFSLFILSIAVSILYQIVGLHLDWRSIVPQFWAYAKTIYFPIASTVLISHLLILKVEQLQLYLFYNVWLKRIFKSLKHLALSSSKEYIRKFSKWILDIFFNDYYDSLILDSWAPSPPIDTYQTWLQQKSYKNRPVFIRREHLMAKNFWPNWAFSIAVLFNELRIIRYQNENNCNKFRLEVDLRNQSYGIYNNAGKTFMTDKFLKEERIDIYTRKAKEIENLLKGMIPRNKLIINAIDTPLRWASGGVLPIAHWRGKHWYVLFFRGINPVGWNVANGASETKEEYKNLRSLMVREFSEELILLNREPQIDDPSPVVQKTFRFSDQIFDELPDKVKDKIRSKKFIERHANLRKNHDGLTISPAEGPLLEPIRTPFEIQITYHSKNLKESFTKSIEDIIFSVNLFEFGIESTSLYAFKMDDNDYLIFGEIWEVVNCLLREPVLLLSCDYIQEVFEKNGGTLGEYVMEGPYLDCKNLKRIPRDKYYIFDKDIEFRKRRKDQITKEEVWLLFSIDSAFQSELDNDNNISKGLGCEFKNRGISLSQNATILIDKKGSIWLIMDNDKQTFLIKEEKGKLNVYKFRTYEIMLEFSAHRRWLENYENLFKDLRKEKCDIEGNKHRPVSMLCPVAWKTLESVCKYNILTNLPW